MIRYKCEVEIRIKKNMNMKEKSIFKKKLISLNIMSDETWAIYGVGAGAELIYEAMQGTPLAETVKYAIDRDEKVLFGKEFHGLPVKKLSEICRFLTGIIIVAPKNHNVIKERIYNYLESNHIEDIRIIDIFAYNSDDEKMEYVKYIEESLLENKTDFVEFNEEGYKRKEKDTKVIAWYLPQFHQLEINNKFHGQGFTEWSNTSRTIPMFVGHYQPHIPYDVGYYDLLNIDTLKRQVYLAKHYGVYGFCFHYYWFSGKKLMEKPLELFLEHKELDIPFCLNWATENWTALWDGGNKDIMLELNLNEGDDIRFMRDILPYMRDSRYIKIHGKPLLIIYRVNLFEQEKIKALIYSFRKKAQESGFPDLYILATTAFDFDEEPAEWGADALVEFPPHGFTQLMEKCRPNGYLNPYFKGEIFDVGSFVKDRKYLKNHNSKTFFRSALTSWDNTARKALSGGMIFEGFKPGTFKQWLEDIVAESIKIHSDAENIVFVNSWNEWAEGSHLEPDMKYGYAYLQMVKEALEGISVK